MDARRAREGHTVELFPSQVSGAELLARPRVHRLQEAKPRRRTHDPGEAARQLARKAEHDLGARDELREPRLVLRRALEAVDAVVIRRVPRRGHQIGLVRDVEARIHLPQPLHVLRLERSCDHHPDAGHLGVLQNPLSMKLFEGKVFDVERHDGLDLIVAGPAVAIVAVDRDGTLTLVRQFRAGARGPVLELPAGRLEPGESPLATAQRELLEETGLHGGAWVELTAVYVTPGICDEKIHIFLATGLEEGEAQPEETEELEPVRVPVAEIPALVPELEDAKTLAGLLLFLRMGL